jgi:uncharacterized membrane-anchored protein YitT (DUF2179 family)
MTKFKFLFKPFIIVLGCFLYALSVKLFLQPVGLITGGSMGIALTVNHFFGLDVNLFVLLFNTAMLILGLIILGKAFALTTVASTFLIPFFMEVIDRTIGQPLLTQDLMLNAIFCGIGIGFSLGIVIREGSSTGGCDIPTIILSKALHIPLSVVVYIFDFAILILQMTFSNVEAILYGILMAVVYTVVMDKMLLMGTTRTEIKLVSDKTEKIVKAIQKKLDRGVTLLHGEGGYLRDQKDVVLSIVSNREVVKVEQIVHEIDPTCFIIINRVSEVKGRGFSMNKERLNKNN